MLTDRLVKACIGAIAVLLTALVLEVSIKSPTPAQATFTTAGASAIYEVRLIQRLDIPGVQQVTPLGISATTGVHFAVSTKNAVFVYRCDYAPTGQ